MSTSPTKPTCIDPSVGETATKALGRTPPKAVEEHRARCMACELERLAFESLDENAVEASPSIQAWVWAVARGQGVPRPR